MTEWETASYRDPLGHIIYSDEKVIRRLSPAGIELFNSFHGSPLFKLLSEKQMIVETKKLKENRYTNSDFPLALEHARIPFISYAYEWPFEMLKDAALFTLEIMLESLGKNFILRDGSSMNVQFRGVRPIFIDILSFAPYEEGGIWIGYSQYCRMFLFPLMLAAHKKADYRPWLRGNIEGISLDDMAGIFGWLDFYKSGVLFQVLIQHRLGRKKESRRVNPKSTMNAEKLGLVVKQLLGVTSSLRSPFKKTIWVDYVDSHSYDAEGKSAKMSFVKKVCGAKQRALVWDIGANTGEYSMVAARNASLVVAMDSDHGAVEKLYMEIRKKGIKNILPLLLDISDPSPACGWLNGETKTVAERGKPDLVLALALIHHLCIARNVTLDSFVNWITGLAPEGVVEFVAKDDPMVQHLLSTREDIFQRYSKENFESLLSKSVVVKEILEIIPGNRYLYHYEAK